MASASPRRRELMTEMGLNFDVRVSEIDESKVPADHPRTYAIRLAYVKAKDVAVHCEEGSIVVAADTVVTRKGMLYGKPANADEARRMLRQLSGETHEVITGVAVARAGSDEVLLDSETTAVHFRPLGGEEIQAYIDTGRVFDKAGGYGIQEDGGHFVDRIDGDYFNVVGLPCGLLSRMLDDVSSGEFTGTVPTLPVRWRK